MGGKMLSTQKVAVCEDKTQANQCIGVSRDGRSTKIHAVVDALGNPIEVMLTAGNVHDVAIAEKLLSQVPLKGTIVLADKAYGKWALREFIADHDADFCIPPRVSEADPWYVDWWLYNTILNLKTLHLTVPFPLWHCFIALNKVASPGGLASSAESRTAKVKSKI